jgi:hypothetical protein
VSEHNGHDPRHHDQHNHDPLPPIPLLRHRDGGDDIAYTHQTTLVGHVIHLGYDTVVLSGGRGTFNEIYMEDLYDLLDGPEMAMNILLDAAEHEDEVHIRLGPGHLSYENPRQTERLAKLVEAG